MIGMLQGDDVYRLPAHLATVPREPLLTRTHKIGLACVALIVLAFAYAVRVFRARGFRIADLEATLESAQARPDEPRTPPRTETQVTQLCTPITNKPLNHLVIESKSPYARKPTKRLPISRSAPALSYHQKMIDACEFVSHDQNDLGSRLETFTSLFKLIGKADTQASQYQDAFETLPEKYRQEWLRIAKEKLPIQGICSEALEAVQHSQYFSAANLRSKKAVMQEISEEAAVNFAQKNGVSLFCVAFYLKLAYLRKNFVDGLIKFDQVCQDFPEFYEDHLEIWLKQEEFDSGDGTPLQKFEANLRNHADQTELVKACLLFVIERATEDAVITCRQDEG